MASASWAYASDQLIALRRQNAIAEAAAPVASGVDLEALNFRYSIDGDNAAWRPLRAFDDGRQVFIEFPRGISRGEMPPLSVIGAEGGAELENYRVQGNHMIVDRLFAAAQSRSAASIRRRCASSAPTEGRSRDRRAQQGAVEPDRRHSPSPGNALAAKARSGHASIPQGARRPWRRRGGRDQRRSVLRLAAAAADDRPRTL